MLERLLLDDRAPILGRQTTDRDRAGAQGCRWGAGRGFSLTLVWDFTGDPRARLIALYGDRALWSADLDLQRLQGFVQAATEAWDYLGLEELYPHGCTPKTPSRLLDELEGRTATYEDASACYASFRSRHDVTSWTADDDGSPFWLLREGTMMLLEANGRVHRWHHGDCMNTLASLVDAVASTCELADPHWPGRKSWQDRGHLDEASLASISLGMSISRVASLRGAGVLAFNRKVVLAGLNEVMAAARMIGNFLPDRQLADVATLVKSHVRRATPRLDVLGTVAVGKAREFEERRPYVQGAEVARWLREELHLRPEDRFEPAAFLADRGVDVVKFRTVATIEAICFWGPDHGPAVLLNTDGRSNRGSSRSGGFNTGGSRATLAHEICHLLLDRGDALPVAEVLGGSVPQRLEERARSFAAELLLPQAVAGATYRQLADVQATLTWATRRFGVSRSLAARQILNSFPLGSPTLGEADRMKLTDVASRRTRVENQAAASGP